MKRALFAAVIFALSASPAFAGYKRGSGSCPAMTADQAVTEIARGTYGPMVQTDCFTAATGRTGQCYTSLEQYRDIIAQVASTANFANDEINMAVYQYARTDWGYGVLIDYRRAPCGRFVWDEQTILDYQMGIDMDLSVERMQ